MRLAAVATATMSTVLVYLPFGRTRLFRRVGERPLPDWAREFDATTWARSFLKFVLAHPAVTPRRRAG